MLFKGSNDLKTGEAILERNRYKEQIFRPFTPKPIDFYYENPLYGKIDRDMNAVIFLNDQSNFKIALDSFEDPTIFAPRFVVRAFNDLKRAFLTVTSDNRGIAPPGLSDLTVKKGYVNFESIYIDHISAMKQALIESFLPRYEKNINNFSDFMKYVEVFAHTSGMRFPLTKTSLLLHKDTTRAVSGLVLELARKDKTRDSEKASLVLSKSKLDKNFVDQATGKSIDYVHQAFEAGFVNNYDWFMNLAANYGFKVNKNAPWVLVADITSEKMQSYLSSFRMSAEPGTASEYFELFCYKSYTDDLESFSEFMFATYREYVERFPYNIVPKYYEGCKFTIATKHKREVLPERETLLAGPSEPAYSKYSMDYWLPILFRVQMHEQDPHFSLREKGLTDAHEFNIIETYNKKGLLAAAKLLNLIVKRHNYSLQNHMPNSYSAMGKTKLADYYSIGRKTDSERREDFSIY